MKTTAEMVAEFIAKGGQITKIETLVTMEIVCKPSGAKTKRRRVKRNWEAQRRYDEEHGTDNGFDPRIEMWKREQ
jgi:hypothetical protein